MGAVDEGVVAPHQLPGDLGAEREEDGAHRIGGRDAEGSRDEGGSACARHPGHARSPALDAVIAHLPGQEEGRDADQHGHEGEYPEAQVQGRWGVLHERSPDQGRQRESRGGRRRGGRAGPARTVPATELHHRGRGRAQREADAHPHQGAADEHPAQVGGEAEDHRTGRHRPDPHENDRATADDVGEVPEDDQHRHEHDRVDGEDRRGHGGREPPLLRVERVHDRGCTARPEGEAGDGCRRPEASALREFHVCRLPSA